ncbi:MAG: ABC transporter ATP-binding protein/permease [Clostridia bacterium]|nr:ABC transporter ATP-binding protein/permease [Clostridia bacterium]
MLTLKDIHKEYPAGDMKVAALRGVSVSFRKSEFVSILGPSGCGKTTLLNIVGGLDQYTSGDLVISGKSTKNFKDADWDAYRNHSIGFVFQSYNLIPHQSVLSNVELALTISGVSKVERRRRAKEALEKVGLASEIHKRPNQMSGGQMQRVAIARALVNNPEILLADEPTGALDSETSVQIMELLKEIAKNRLVIMVTHNPELAETYSTRIIRILDGQITGDTNPYEEPQAKETPVETKPKKEKRVRNRSMSFGTALSLSLNNLRTKKGRTLLTSFAGSIGIIGIALILSISNGVTNYINRVQEDTLSSYPISIPKETADMSSIITTMMNANAASEDARHERDAVYSNRVMYELLSSISNTEVQTNNLSAFKSHIEKTPAFKDYASAIDYSYAMDFHIYTKDKDGNIIKSDIQSLMEEMFAENSGSAPMGGNMGMFASYGIWQEMLAGTDGEPLSDLFYEQYDLVYGAWPENYNEIVLIVDKNNEISDIVLYSLGLKTTEEMKEEMRASMMGETEVGVIESWSYEDICDMTFKMILPPDFYQKNKDGTYTDLSASNAGLTFLYDSDKPIELKVSGIIRPNDDAVSSMMTGSIGYTSALTEYAIERAAESEIVKAQLANPTIDVISGLPYKTEGEDEISDAEKARMIKEHFDTLTVAEKAALYTEIKSVMPEMELQQATAQYMSQYTTEQLKALAVESYAEQMGITDTAEIEKYIDAMSEEELQSALMGGIAAQIAANYAAEVRAQLATQTAETLAILFDAETFTEAEYAGFFDLYMPATSSDMTYEETLSLLGYVDMDDPSAISIYAASFEDKDEIAALIAEYNESVSEVDKINYTDYVALLMSSITLVINAISYVLIAFVSVSLVVSSIMIGIITYISVLERTKEIGILRAIGASKKDVSRVFNAETAIVGFASGAIGIGMTLLLIMIANPILHAVTGIEILNASLPVAGAVILVILSVGLTLIAGLIPSRVAAKKDPVVALRTE